MGKLRHLILVGDIPMSSNKEDMVATFAQFGEIKNVFFFSFPRYLPSGKPAPLDSEKPILGHYCFINFSEKVSQDKCIFAKVTLKGKHLIVTKVSETEVTEIIKSEKKKQMLRRVNAEAEIDEEDEVGKYLAEGKGGELSSEVVVETVCRHLFIAEKIQAKGIVLYLIDFFNSYLARREPEKRDLEKGAIERLLKFVDIKVSSKNRKVIK